MKSYRMVINLTARKKKDRTQQRTEATRDALIQAARQVFSEKGLDLTTIDDITERADVGKGTFYYHFENKANLISELMSSVMSDLAAASEAKCSSSDTLEGLLDLLIKSHVDFFNNRWEDFVIHFQGRADITLQKGYEGIDASFNEYLDRIAALLDAVIKHHLDRNTLLRISCAVAGFVSGYYSFAVIFSEEKDFEENLQAVRGALVAAMSRFIKESISDKESPARW